MPDAAGRSPPGVLQVLPALHSGGVETGTVDVAAALVAAGWRSLVASAGGRLVGDLEAGGSRHLTLPLEGKNPLGIWLNGRRLARIAAAEGISILHARSRAPAWSALVAARRTGLPLVTTFHGTYGARTALKRRYNAVMLRSDHVIANSAFTARHIEAVYGRPPVPMTVIPRGIDMHRYDPQTVARVRQEALARDWGLPEGVPVILLPGRLTGWKGQMVMVQAMARLRDRGAVCVLAGDDRGRESYRQQLQEAVRQAGLGERVLLPGRCDDMAAAYLLADVVVSASTEPEAFGRVTAEAQAMGRPVVATSLGATPENLVDGVTGWLVPPNDPAALAAGIERVLALDAGHLARLAEIARSRVAERCSLESMTGATLQVYRQVLELHDRRRRNERGRDERGA
ncbi:glycosyltransferase family 4 protein [Marinibaculum pumilum]|uniref:Glycosyltransferase family 4 protein n=1 Tax=Marinibaculum pumilum TaxID=1766165 RepID=A0ABV7L742_9PROT